MNTTTPSGEAPFVHTMGKAIRVIDMFPTDDEVNAYMATHPEAALLAIIGGMRLLAEKHDHGIALPRRDGGRRPCSFGSGRAPTPTACG
ncbi:MAG: hypothetical protein U1E45_16410 [Geminicoccaceae bacterium]